MPRKETADTSQNRKKCKKVIKGQKIWYLLGPNVFELRLNKYLKFQEQCTLARDLSLQSIRAIAWCWYHNLTRLCIRWWMRLVSKMTTSERSEKYQINNPVVSCQPSLCRTKLVPQKDQKRVCLLNPVRQHSVEWRMKPFRFRGY